MAGKGRKSATFWASTLRALTLGGQGHHVCGVRGLPFEAPPSPSGPFSSEALPLRGPPSPTFKTEMWHWPNLVWPNMVWPKLVMRLAKLGSAKVGVGQT